MKSLEFWGSNVFNLLLGLNLKQQIRIDDQGQQIRIDDQEQQIRMDDQKQQIRMDDQGTINMHGWSRYNRLC